MPYHFSAIIYKLAGSQPGIINYAVDVPVEITSAMVPVKRYIRIKGTVNGIPFTKSLVPVKDAAYRLFVNTVTLKNIRGMVGEEVELTIEPDTSDPALEHPLSPELAKRLNDEGVLALLHTLSPSRQKEIIRYLNNLKTPETLEMQVLKLIKQLKSNAPGQTRIP